jgi:hypothetical protein
LTDLQRRELAQFPIRRSGGYNRRGFQAYATGIFAFCARPLSSQMQLQALRQGRFRVARSIGRKNPKTTARGQATHPEFMVSSWMPGSFLDVAECLQIQ